MDGKDPFTQFYLFVNGFSTGMQAYAVAFSKDSSRLAYNMYANAATQTRIGAVGPNNTFSIENILPLSQLTYI